MLRPLNKFPKYHLTSSDKNFLDFVNNLFIKLSIGGNLLNEKKKFLIMLLLNLKKQYDSNTYINVPLRKDYYSNIPAKYRLPFMSYEVTKQIIEGLNSNDYIDLDKGEFNMNTTSSCKATNKLFSHLNGYSSDIITGETPKSFVILRELVSNTSEYEDIENIEEELDLINDEENSKKGKHVYQDIDYDNEQADLINAEVKEYATLREKSKLTLQNIPNDIFRTYQNALENISLESISNILPDINGNYSLNLMPSYPVRIFNTDFNHGGRFYRGIETAIKQRDKKRNIKIKLRQYIHINGKPTVELDYNAMHPRLLYNMENIDYRKDPYTIGRNCSEEYRNIYKLVTMICINSKNENAAIDGIQLKLQEANLTQYLKDNTDATRRKLINSVRRHNKDIEKHFFTGIGLKLQNIDSDIAHSILLHFARKGVLVLSIHDSFIIDKKYEKELRQKMREIYFEKVGFQPRIK